MDNIEPPASAADLKRRPTTETEEISASENVVETSDLHNHLVAHCDENLVEVNLTDVISCTACHRQINIKKAGSVHEHPVLRVLICKSCFKWYTSGTIEQGSDGLDEQCRWCGEGGKLVLCDFCHNAFCKDCVQQNLGRQELSKITAENSKWHCYVCNPAPLKDLVTYCARLQEVLKPCDGDSTVQTSGTDTDSNCAGKDDGECSFTSANVDSLADELYTETNTWIKKLSKFRSSLKGLKSKGGARENHQKVDLAKKISQHFKSLDSFLAKMKKKAHKKRGGRAKKKKVPTATLR